LIDVDLLYFLTNDEHNEGAQDMHDQGENDADRDITVQDLVCKKMSQNFPCSQCNNCAIIIFFAD
jgi:hypothetical protein